MPTIAHIIIIRTLIFDKNDGPEKNTVTVDVFNETKKFSSSISNFKRLIVASNNYYRFDNKKLKSRFFSFGSLYFLSFV